MPGSPRNAPEDRAFAAMVEEFDMPRALPEALLEGLAWDAVERRYDTCRTCATIPPGWRRRSVR